MSIHGNYGNYAFGKHTGAIDFNGDKKIEPWEQMKTRNLKMHEKMKRLAQRGFHHFRGLAEGFKHHPGRVQGPQHGHGGFHRPEEARRFAGGSIFGEYHRPYGAERRFC